VDPESKLYIDMIEKLESKIESKGKEAVITQVCKIFNELIEQELSKPEKMESTKIFQNKLIVANAYLDPPDGYNNVGLDARDMKNPIHTQKREDFLSILRYEFQELPN
jgi:hypothetical protein